MHLRRRHDDTRAGLADLAPYRRIERRKPDVATFYHVSFSSSSFPNSGQTNASSPAATSARVASAQPSRTCPFGLRITMASFSMSISTSRTRPTCASSGFGMIIPWELPTRRSAARMLEQWYNVPTCRVKANPRLETEEARSRERAFSLPPTRGSTRDRRGLCLSACTGCGLRGRRRWSRVRSRLRT